MKPRNYDPFGWLLERLVAALVVTVLFGGVWLATFAIERWIEWVGGFRVGLFLALWFGVVWERYGLLKRGGWKAFLKHKR